MAKQSKNSFAFNLDLSAEENITLFLESLKDLDDGMAGLLRAHVGKLLPLPEGQARTTARAAVHREVVKALDKLAE